MSFAFKIDKALKANLYKICRLCGIDRDEKVDILNAENAAEEDPVDCDGDLKLHQKIMQCIGIEVCKDDKMPQSACSLCVDKINDFYEFREMCYATDVQTRKLLGLKGEPKKKTSNADIKLFVDIKEESTVKRGRKRKSDEVITREEANEVKRESGAIPINKKQRLNEQSSVAQKKVKLGKQFDKTMKPKEEIKEEPVDVKSSTPNSNVTKFRQVCNICDQRFGSKVKLEQHVVANHVPTIPRYVCTACNETIKKTNDIKSHQLWHKLSKTPYVCGHCGQSLISSYAYSRHLRDHTVEIPPNLWILDRECPQCHQTFITNFLYNTHSCAVRTKKCAGCNRQLRNEVEYQRHAAHCAKVYLNYSKHIPAAAVAAESSVRIKNENDVEAAAAAESLARNSGLSLDMAPVVSLTRISTPEIMAASQGQTAAEHTNEAVKPIDEDAKTPGKKGSKKGVSRKDLKRVDDLLKSTLDALVSIKHEPEVHVETDVETLATADVAATKEYDVESVGGDDFHHGDDDDDDDDGDTSDIAIKQESLGDTLIHASLNIKQEIVDVDNENTAPATKMPVLKLKIKKEHGTLNSSLVEEQSVRVEKKKKKKKRKEAERNKDKPLDGVETVQESVALLCETMADEYGMSFPGVLGPIKQECLEDNGGVVSESNRTGSSESMQPEATVMTTIPIPQFQISAVSSGVAFAESVSAVRGGEDTFATAEAAANPVSESNTDIVELEDVKPNKAELDRLFKITNVSSGVEMDHWENEIEKESDGEIDSETECATLPDVASILATPYLRNQNPEDTNLNVEIARRSNPKSAPKPSKYKVLAQKSSHNKSARAAKAFKSTGGGNKNNTNMNSYVGNTNSGDFTQIHIKPEPVDHGYEDVFNAYESAADVSTAQPMHLHEELTMREIAEQEYLNSIDFTNVQIKQEKDLEVSEVQMTNTHIVANAIPNGMKRTESEESQFSGNEEDIDDSMDNEDSDEEDYEDDEEDDGNDDDWVGVRKEKEEVREYRELEMPPLLSTEDKDTEEKESEVTDKVSSGLDKDVLVNASGTGMGGILVNELTANSVVTINTSNPNAGESLAPPFMITNIYSGAECSRTNKYLETHATDPQLAEQDHIGTVIEPGIEVNTLKISSVVAGCTTSFNDFSRYVHQEQINLSSFDENLPLAVPEAAMEVGNVSEASDLPGDDVEMALMRIDVKQEKDVMLNAQPFSDPGAMRDTRLTADSDPNASENILVQDNADGVNAATSNVVEEVQNILNHEVAEAQAIQRLAMGSNQTAPLTHTSANVEEAENLMNESVAEAQMRQQLESQTISQVNNDTRIGSNSSVRSCDPDAEKSCSSRSSSSSSGCVIGSGGSTSISHALMIDDSNINEIAENNNNANIERELQDDVASAAAAVINANVTNDAANTGDEQSSSPV